MIIDRLQYITQQGPRGESHLEMMDRACRNGVRWVQLRMKDLGSNELLLAAREAKLIAERYNSTLIINDHVEVAKEVEAHGVHVGLNDMPVKEARRILGNNVIIGGTANDLTAILKHVDEGADYVGVGPFRFTSSKKDLSPVVGKEGYEKIINELERRGIDVPVIAIGGILLNDLHALGNTGVHGVAVASLINSAEKPESLIGDLYKEIEKWKN